MDELASLGSQQSQKMHRLYKEIRNNSILLCLCMYEIEQSSLMAVRNPGVPPPKSESAAPSPPIVHMSQMDGVSGVVQGSKQTIISLSQAPTGSIIKAWPHFLPIIMVLTGWK